MVRWKSLADENQRTFAVIFEEGDEVAEGLSRFAREAGIAAAGFTGTGAFEHAELGFFFWDRKEYEQIPVNEQVEVLTLAGDIAEKDGHPVVCAHCVLGRSDGSTVGGHLLAGTVRPALEVVVTETPEPLRKKHDEKTGFALIEIE